MVYYLAHGKNINNCVVESYYKNKYNNWDTHTLTTIHNMLLSTNTVIIAVVTDIILSMTRYVKIRASDIMVFTRQTHVVKWEFIFSSYSLVIPWYTQHDTLYTLYVKKNKPNSDVELQEGIHKCEHITI